MSQPAILRRRVLRLAIGVVVIAALVYLFMAYVRGARSLDPGDFQSAGYIAATMDVGDGEQVVMIAPDGTIVKSPGYSEGSDTSPTWLPDGQRILFASDRETDDVHLYRWNPARNIVERRSIDKRAKTWLVFDQSAETKDPTALVGSGGSVIAVEPKVPYSRQIMPPRGSAQHAADVDSGATSAFDQAYAGIGTSVKVGRWSGDRSYMLAVMRREEGEILVAQKTFKEDRPVDPTDVWKLDMTKPPILVVAGDRVDFDINPTTGVVVYTCQNFAFPTPQMVPPQMKKDGKVVLPFKHVVGLYKPGEGGMYEASPTARNLIAVGQDDKFAFASPKISPDGTEVVCLIGPYLGAGMIDAHNLVLMPAAIAGGQQSVTLVSDPTIDVSWHPNGRSLLFVAVVEGERSIFSINRDKSDLKNLTKGKGNFSTPSWSPMTK